MYKVSLAYIALTRNKNNPNHTNSMKFNGGKLVDHPIRTEIDVGAVAPWIRIIPNHPHISGIFKFLIIIISPFFILYSYYTCFNNKCQEKNKKNPLISQGISMLGGVREFEREEFNNPQLLYNTKNWAFCQDIFRAEDVVSRTLRVHPLPNVSKVDSFS